MKGKLVEGMSCSSGEVNRECEACAQGKMHRVPFPKKSEKETYQPLQLVHSDLCGPMNVDSVGGSKYILTFTDDYTRYVTAFFIKSKSEVLSKFMEYVAMMENETGLRVRSIRTDNGGEYTSQCFKKFCSDKGIAHQLTNPYTPEQNGVSERLNRTLVESARSMLIHAKMPLKFWAEAVNTAVYLHNRSPTSALKDKTPFESWFGKKPNVSHFKVFGSVCFVHTPDHLRKKLEYLSDIHWKGKATKCMNWMLNVSQKAETLFFMRTSFILLMKLPTAHSSMKTVWMTIRNPMMPEMS